MKTKWILLVVAGLSVIVAPPAPARSADLQPMVATGLTGNLHIHQDIPICDDLDFDVPVVGGRIEISPTDGFDVGGGSKSFTFTRMNVFFNGFHTHVSCLGSDDDETFSEVGATLAQAVRFTGSPAGPGVYNFTISKDAFLVHEDTIRKRNSDPAGPDDSFKHPSENVTGFIDLNLGKVHVHVKIATKLHIEFGPISEDKDGSQTADIDGTITFPDSDGDGVPDRSDNCKFTANPLQDVIATPVITAPPNLTLNSCLDHHIGFAASTDICNGRAVTITNDAPGQFAIGPNTVTWNGNDGTDPVVHATQTVTIVDTTPPAFTSVPPDIFLNDCQGTALGTPTATDDCAGTVTFTNNAPPKYFVGATVVTWTAHDVSGNTTNATQTVTVTDTVPPTVSCVATGPPTGHLFIASASDACGAPVIRLGSFVLANGEVVKIQVTGQPGVRLINDVSSNNIRHFQVGKGEDMITATDGSGNVTAAICR
jgi:hypothetical protein